MTPECNNISIYMVHMIWLALCCFFISALTQNIWHLVTRIIDLIVFDGIGYAAAIIAFVIVFIMKFVFFIVYLWWSSVGEIFSALNFFVSHEIQLNDLLCSIFAIQTRYPNDLLLSHSFWWNYSNDIQSSIWISDKLPSMILLRTPSYGRWENYFPVRKRSRLFISKFPNKIHWLTEIDNLIRFVLLTVWIRKKNRCALHLMVIIFIERCVLMI